ncbi:YaeQ family protein [Thiopseudomonas acetoxidans]|uniref:YaeQ family protein n=1 Tax=Thiopseudomonas acetoxidans TaxID=3041622 RepID=A0ABT7SRK5_9GAMM|nr:YaeQ family protein [Thiopseudomonas sp. CY1220]MDM7858786.1 YaeQ family protein [Thiopseudomonas sp. CY1220]
MATKPTIYKLHIALSDFNRDYYDSAHLTAALHPSETLERMMVRVVAYCLNAQEHITFTKGLSMVEEPDIWVKTLDDQIALWVDVGEPTADRIKKASRIATGVKVYSFNSKSNVWWEQNKNKLHPFKNVQFYQFDWQQIQTLASLTERTMNWSLSISGDTVYIAAENQTCELVIKELI